MYNVYPIYNVYPDPNKSQDIASQESGSLAHCSNLPITMIST